MKLTQPTSEKTEKTTEKFLRESNAIEDVQDEQSLADAKEAWEFIVKKKVLTTRNILMAHKTLMKNQRIEDWDKGHFRTCSVFIGGHEAKPWYVVPEMMGHWVMNANDLTQNGKSENSVFLERMVKQHHVNFESIHPFVDGNGRIGRILFNWQRVRVGLPILVIEYQKRQEYYNWFS